MNDPLIRGVVFAPLAILLPLGVARLHARWARAIFAVAWVVLGFWPHLDERKVWIVALATVALAVAAPRPDVKAPWLTLALAAIAGGLSLAALGAGDGGHALNSTLNSRDVALALAGGATCVFLGGAAIGIALHPFAERVQIANDSDAGGVQGMENAGRIIGWLERALLYGLFLAGAPDAAALVIAGKSIARFPAFSQERFAEYYLIGTLLSLVIAAGGAIAVRAMIGLPAVPK